MSESVCAAHNILYDQVTRLQKNQGELFDLIRDNTALSASRSESFAVSLGFLQTSTEAGFEKVASQFSSITEQIGRVESMLKDKAEQESALRTVAIRERNQQRNQFRIALVSLCSAVVVALISAGALIYSKQSNQVAGAKTGQEARP